LPNKSQPSAMRWRVGRKFALRSLPRNWWTGQPAIGSVERWTGGADRGAGKFCDIQIP
jgi:hypothetical protein